MRHRFEAGGSGGANASGGDGSDADDSHGSHCSQPAASLSQRLVIRPGSSGGTVGSTDFLSARSKRGANDASCALEALRGGGSGALVGGEDDFRTRREGTVSSRGSLRVGSTNEPCRVVAFAKAATHADTCLAAFKRAV